MNNKKHIPHRWREWENKDKAEPYVLSTKMVEKAENFRKIERLREQAELKESLKDY